MIFNYFVIFGMMLGFISGCASTDKVLMGNKDYTVIDHKPDAIPLWVSGLPFYAQKSQDYTFYKGTSSQFIDLVAGCEQAKTLATDQLVNEVATFIKERTHFVPSDLDNPNADTIDFNQLLNTQIQSMNSKIKNNGFFFIEEKSDKYPDLLYKCWVLLKISNEDKEYSLRAAEQASLDFLKKIKDRQDALNPPSEPSSASNIILKQPKPPGPTAYELSLFYKSPQIISEHQSEFSINVENIDKANEIALSILTNDSLDDVVGVDLIGVTEKQKILDDSCQVSPESGDRVCTIQSSIKAPFKKNEVKKYKLTVLHTKKKKSFLIELSYTNKFVVKVQSVK
jgi:hypothetical protein